MHTFITPTYRVRKTEQMCKSAYYVMKKVTGIPPPWDKKFDDCSPVLKYKYDLKAFGQTLLNFCEMDSDSLKHMNIVGVQVLKDFSKSDFTFVAKGIDMEQTILWDMMGIKHDVQEFEDIFHQKYKAKANMKDIHAHSRPKDYCEFHSSVKQNL